MYGIRKREATEKGKRRTEEKVEIQKWYSQRLKPLRKEYGLTQEQLANALSIDRSSYSYWENGKAVPHMAALVKLAKIYQIPIQQLIFDGDSTVCELGKTKNSLALRGLEKDEMAFILRYRVAKQEDKNAIQAILSK